MFWFGESSLGCSLSWQCSTVNDTYVLSKPQITSLFIFNIVTYFILLQFGSLLTILEGKTTVTNDSIPVYKMLVPQFHCNHNYDWLISQSTSIENMFTPVL